MTTTDRFTIKVTFRTTKDRLTEPTRKQEESKGRIPRVTRLLALAHRFDKLVREGHVRDYADLARLGQVTRARLTQIMNLLYLAPDIQEDILLLPAVEKGGDPFHERHLRPIASVPDWSKQRSTFRHLCKGSL